MCAGTGGKKKWPRTKKVIACADSGSDLTLMQETLYKQLVNRYPLKESSVGNVTSYSSNAIHVIGEKIVLVKFSPDKNSPIIPLYITIIKDIPGSTAPFLFGNVSFKSCLATLAYTGDFNNPQPEFVINNPCRIIPKIHYVTPFETTQCRGNYNLGPYESQNLTLRLHPAAAVCALDQIIVNSTEWGKVQILSSKSEVEYEDKTGQFLAQACILNLTCNTLKGQIVGEFETITDKYTEYPITQLSKPVSIIFSEISASPE